MLRWNRNALFLAVLILLGGAIERPESVLAQTAAGAERGRLLVDGPTEDRGLDFLGPNIVPYLAADYYDHEQERNVEVFFVDRDIAIPAAAEAAACGSYEVRVFEDNNPPLEIRAFESIEGWLVFFLFPVPYTDPCRFVEDFLELFIFFRRALDDETPFPAALELQ